MELAWWHWVVAGIALALGELGLGSFFVIWFGLGALVVGMALLALPGLAFSTQIILWTLSSLVMTGLWFLFGRGKDAQLGAGQAADVIGEIGVLVSAVEPFQKGQVRFQKPLMGSEVWPCIADEAIAAGQRVRVVMVDGQLLKVGPTIGAAVGPATSSH